MFGGIDDLRQLSGDIFDERLMITLTVIFSTVSLCWRLFEHAVMWSSPPSMLLSEVEKRPDTNAAILSKAWPLARGEWRIIL